MRGRADTAPSSRPALWMNSNVGIDREDRIAKTAFRNHCRSDYLSERRRSSRGADDAHTEWLIRRTKTPPKKGRPPPGGEEAEVVVYQPRGVGLMHTRQKAE
jgi:hypothetical protein